jgi:hypothetical protein
MFVKTTRLSQMENALIHVILAFMLKQEQEKSRIVRTACLIVKYAIIATPVLSVKTDLTLTLMDYVRKSALRKQLLLMENVLTVLVKDAESVM